MVPGNQICSSLCALLQKIQRCSQARDGLAQASCTAGCCFALCLAPYSYYQRQGGTLALGHWLLGHANPHPFPGDADAHDGEPSWTPRWPSTITWNHACSSAAVVCQIIHGLSRAPHHIRLIHAGCCHRLSLASRSILGLLRSHGIRCRLRVSLESPSRSLQRLHVVQASP